MGTRPGYLYGMTFNPNADISGNRTSKRGRNTAIVGGGGVGIVGLLVFLIGPLLGVDVTGLMGGITPDDGGQNSSSVSIDSGWSGTGWQSRCWPYHPVIVTPLRADPPVVS
jgi:predicted metalloprotease